MIKIAIVEDEKADAIQLQEYLHKYEKEKGEVFKISLFSDGDEIVHKYKPEYDVILMDVEMNFMNGMAAAEEIRKVDSEVVIIFITKNSQYAIHGYAVDALDYVLKPISYFAFSQKLSRAINRMKKRERKTLTVSIKGGAIRLDMAHITYIESYGHTLVYHTVNGTYETNGTMKNLEAELAAYHFCRGNKGYLINLAYVEAIKESYAIVKGEKILLSRSRRKDFMETLTGYWGEVMK